MDTFWYVLLFVLLAVLFYGLIVSAGRRKPDRYKQAKDIEEIKQMMQTMLEKKEEEDKKQND